RVSSLSTEFGCRSAPMGFTPSLSESGGIPGRRRCIPMRGRRDAMLEILVARVLGLVLVVGPLAWRVERDRRESRALATRAYVQSLIDRRLGGAAFVSGEGTPRSLLEPC